MSNFLVCARFRPLSSREKRDHGTNACIQRIDDEAFIFKDEKDGDTTFSFDRVFYEESNQISIYEFLALPIVHDAVNGINGTIITYGQELTRSILDQGPSVIDCDEQKKGLLPRVVEGIFEIIKSSHEATTYLVKFSMVEIYMEKVRDLFDLSKENIQIKESKLQGIILNGVTEITALNCDEALQKLYSGISNRAVGETLEMNMASSRSHCIYLFTVQQELLDEKSRTKSGKLILVDLAGSEKVEKTGAEGRVLEEAKTINKSLSALGNVVNALTCSPQGKANHIPYRDSKLTRILQDALGGNSRTALLCCCSPSSSNASESLSTLRFGLRAKHIKASPRVNHIEDRNNKQEVTLEDKDESYERIMKKLRERLGPEEVELLEELLVLEGIIFHPNSIEDLESVYEDVTIRTILSLQQAVEELVFTVEELKKENKELKARLATAETLVRPRLSSSRKACFWDMISGALGYLSPGPHHRRWIRNLEYETAAWMAD
ncbi:serine/threonine-protein kinase KIN2 [Ancistrocladus abbreviatus]